MNEVEFISSYKFSKIADVVYSGIFLEEQIRDLNLKNFKVLQKNQDYLEIKTKEFELKENFIIFSRIDDLEGLFYLLKNVNLENIKLISHQSDKSITEKLYKSKPKCISSWFSVNIDIIKDDLISIPIGLANNHPKNLSPNDFTTIKNTNNLFFSNYKEKEIIYVNFQKSTNYKEREKIYNFFSKFEWAKVQNPNQDKKIYLKNLNEIFFTLTPFGNGFDTHRFWEALYSGSVPVLKYHKSYEYAKDLPVLFIDEYSNITEDYLLNEIPTLVNKSYNFEKLYFDYWEKSIKNNNLPSIASSFINSDIAVVKFFEIKNLFVIKINSYKKIIFYYLRKIKGYFSSQT